MGRPRTIDDDALLAAARGVFQTHGHTATTRDVARAAGISQAVLYQRFPTKDALFFAAMLPPAPDVAALLSKAPEPGAAGPAATEAYLGDVAERVLAYFAGIAPAVLHLVTHPAFGPEVVVRAHERLLGAGLPAALADRLRTLQAGGLVGPVDADAAAAALVAALHSQAMFRLVIGPATGTEAHAMEGAGPSGAELASARSLVTVLWHGLAPIPAGPHRD